MKTPQIEYDTSFGTAYVKLNNREVHSTTEYDDVIFVDRDVDGRVVGVEHIDLNGPLPVSDLVRALRLDSSESHALEEASRTLVQLMSSTSMYSTDGSLHMNPSAWQAVPA